MVIPKGSYVYGELKNVLPSSVKETHLPVRGQKIPRYMWGGIGRRMEICETSYTPIPIVPRLNQCNGDIKGKLRVWRAQKCIVLDVAENPLTSSGQKNTPLHVGRYRTENGNMRNIVHPNPHGTTFAPKQWLYQR